MVATAMGIDAERIEVVVDGDLDLRGTLGIDREGPGRLRGDPRPLRGRRAAGLRGGAGELIEKTERYCTVLQSLRVPSPVSTELAANEQG